MKKILASFLLLLLLLTVCACENNSASPTPAPTEKPKPVITDDQADLLTETWIAAELTFTSSATYESNKQSDVILDAVFTNQETGTSLTIPAFWDGQNIFRVRFAPTEYGIWEYKTVCATDESLNGLTGKVGANVYTGDLAIYQHGFVTVSGKHFVYADGTPFFYLGDTHWNYLTEEFDAAGPGVGELRGTVQSHFKYIVDKRVAQGFTVYQSEPIGAAFDLKNGLTTADIRGFQKADQYYQYIAQKGLVHANSEFFWVMDWPDKYVEDYAYIEKISRYWVARFGAYPVMWTIAQESDNDYFTELGLNKKFDYTNNPWVKAAEYIHKYDAYLHPLSAHQEGTNNTTVTGSGTDSQTSNRGASAYLLPDVTERTGHNWWASQYMPARTQLREKDALIEKDYYKSPKPAVIYEPYYCYLATKDFGSRIAGWVGLLSGYAGIAYGANDIWLYNGNYYLNTTDRDGIDVVTPEDKHQPWSYTINLPSGDQMGYIRAFAESFNWWELKPDFFDRERFAPYENALYRCAYIGDDLTLVYLYNRSEHSGEVRGLTPDATYKLSWFNPRENTRQVLNEKIKANQDGKISLPDKPDNLDCVMILEKIK